MRVTNVDCIRIGSIVGCACSIVLVSVPKLQESSNPEGQVALKYNLKENSQMKKSTRVPRYNVVSMRISDNERKQLEEIVVNRNMSISEFMRVAFENYTTCLH